MKKTLSLSLVIFMLTLLLSGCSGVGSKSANVSLAYLVSAVISLMVFVCYLFIKEKDRWFVILFASVFIVNIGYYLLAVSPTLSFALWANRIAYLGSVFLPISMLIIILDTVDIKYRKWLPYALCAIGGFVFLVAASPGILDIYYKEVSLVVVNGVSTLKKVYGPLHVVNLLYLLSIFTLIVTSIIYAITKKKIKSPIYSVILASAVFLNIGVWFIEQLVDIGFEILSISYIISEIFLLAVNVLMAENEKLKTVSTVKEAPEKKEALNATTSFSADSVEIYLDGQASLTQTERLIFDLYTTGKSTKEIMAEMNITENTLKFHNKNIYGKLGVSSRKQLVEIYRYISTGK